MSSYQDLSRIDEEQKPLIEAWEKHIAKHNIHPQYVIDKTWTHHDPELRTRMLDMVQHVTDAAAQHGLRDCVLHPNVTFECMVLSLVNKYFSPSIQESLLIDLIKLNAIGNTYTQSSQSSIKAVHGSYAGAIMSFGIPDIEGLFESLRILSSKIVEKVNVSMLHSIYDAVMRIPGVQTCTMGTRSSTASRGPRYNYSDSLREIVDGKATSEHYMVKQSISDLASVSVDVIDNIHNVIVDVAIPVTLHTCMGKFTYYVFLFRCACVIPASEMYDLRKRRMRTDNDFYSLSIENMRKFISLRRYTGTSVLGFFDAILGKHSEYSDADTRNVFNTTATHLAVQRALSSSVESVSFINPVHIT